MPPKKDKFRLAVIPPPFMLRHAAGGSFFKSLGKVIGIRDPKEERKRDQDRLKRIESVVGPITEERVKDVGKRLLDAWRGAGAGAGKARGGRKKRKTTRRLRR